MVPSRAMAESSKDLTGPAPPYLMALLLFFLRRLHALNTTPTLVRVRGESSRRTPPRNTSRRSLQHSLGPDREPAAGPHLDAQTEGRGRHGATPYGRRRRARPGHVRVKRPYLLIWDGTGRWRPRPRNTPPYHHCPRALVLDEGQVRCSLCDPHSPLLSLRTVFVAQRFSQSVAAV